MDGTISLIKKFKSDLDAIAELAWHESKTAAYIIKQLGNDYVWFEKNAIIYSLGNGTPIFFRAELDALQTPSGIKHVCGHAAHMAALMAAYLYFKKNPPKYKIYFVFQPSEEGYPSGAEFITKNFLKNHPVKAGFAFHVSGGGKKIGDVYDVQMASGDYFEIILKSISSHVKNKNTHPYPDILAIAGDMAKTINTKKYKNIIINIGTIQGGETPNSIAGSVKMTGDIRTNNEKLRIKAKQILESSINIYKKKLPSQVSLNFYHSFGYPVLQNDKTLLKKLSSLFQVKDRIESFGTEDFSLYPKPFVFLYIGTGKKESIHEEKFVVPQETTVHIYNNWIKLGIHLSL